MSWPFGRCYCDFIKNARKELVKDDQHSVCLPRHYILFCLTKRMKLALRGMKEVDVLRIYYQYSTYSICLRVHILYVAFAFVPVRGRITI